MPPERHSGPGARPPRDRHTGPGFAGPRRGFSGGGPPFSGGGPRDHAGPPRAPFTPRPAAPPPPADAPQWVRLREGDREVEVHGSPVFVRQTLDDLPALFARLRGEVAPQVKPPSISMPRSPRSEAATTAEAWTTEPHAGSRVASRAAGPDDDGDDDADDEDEEREPPARPRRDRHAKAATTKVAASKAPKAPAARSAANGARTLEDRVFRTLERADHPLSVAAIRKQLGGDTTGQQIRRILERAADRVVATSERPAAYALR